MFDSYHRIDKFREKKYSLGDLPLYTPIDLYELMINLPLGEFYRLNRDLIAIRGYLESYNETHPGENESMDEETKNSVISDITILGKLCVDLGLESSRDLVEEMIQNIPRQYYTFKTLITDYNEVERRVRHDCTRQTALIIPRPIAAKYYQKPAQFGQDVFAKFPSIENELEEAGNCYALERYTGAVFHLARIVEIALKSYSGFLGYPITTQQPSWGEILRDTFKEIGERDKKVGGKSWGSPQEQSFAKEAQTLFMAVKTAYRDPTAHVEKSYKDYQAKAVMDTVENVMIFLAEHLDEQGNFTP